MTDDMWNDEGGPAFPLVVEAAGTGGTVSYKGMSLRDYFAGQALAGILAGQRQRHGVPLSEWLAAPRDAYAFADGMIEARKVQP